MEVKRKWCDLAVGSLVFGLLSVPFGFLAGIPAVVCGLLALLRIRKAGGMLAGRGMAVAGSVVGILMSTAGFLTSPTLTIRKANALQSRTDLTALMQATDRFYSEYSKLPDAGASDFMTDDAAGRKLLVTVLGKEVPGPAMMNPRQVPFLSIKVGKHKKKGGLIYAPGTSGAIDGLYDAWGNPFRVVLDNDYDDVLRFSYGGKPVEVRGHPCVVASKGPDGVEGTEDDLKSWSDSR